MVAVEQYFKLKDAEITKIYYDEEKANEDVETYMTYGKGSQNDINPDNVLIIYTDFTVSSDENETIDAGDYKAQKWILIREDKNSDWKVDDYGY